MVKAVFGNPDSNVAVLGIPSSFCILDDNTSHLQWRVLDASPLFPSRMSCRNYRDRVIRIMVFSIKTIKKSAAFDEVFDELK